MSRQPAPIPPDVLAQIRHTLAHLPPKPAPALTRRAAVAQLEGEIRHAIAHLGYSLTDIAEFFTAAGAAVQPDTIGNALRNLRPKAAPKRRTAKHAKPADATGIAPETTASLPEGLPPVSAIRPPDKPDCASSDREAAPPTRLVFHNLPEVEPETSLVAVHNVEDPDGARG